MRNLWLKLGGIGLAGVWTLASPQGAFANHPDFASLDTNGDGKVSLTEFESHATTKFTSMDANSDGKVTVAEMDAYKAQRGQSGKEKKASKGTEMSSADKIKKVDANGDGVLTAEENTAGAKTKFEEMDTSKDGSLSKTELDTGYAKLRKAAGK
jgi:Ca2+-binding EF-hand superfamily protein